jgi:hypothetical protein
VFVPEWRSLTDRAFLGNTGPGRSLHDRHLYRSSRYADPGPLSLAMAGVGVEPVPRALVELVARDRHFATLYALRATDRLFRAAGSQVLFEGNELQRCLRDVHAVASRTTRLGAIAGPTGPTEV